LIILAKTIAGSGHSHSIRRLSANDRVIAKRNQALQLQQLGVGVADGMPWKQSSRQHESSFRICRLVTLSPN